MEAAKTMARQYHTGSIRVLRYLTSWERSPQLVFLFVNFPNLGFSFLHWPYDFLCDSLLHVPIAHLVSMGHDGGCCRVCRNTQYDGLCVLAGNRQVSSILAEHAHFIEDQKERGLPSVKERLWRSVAFETYFDERIKLICGWAGVRRTF